jgi:hypothetical protein
MEGEGEPAETRGPRADSHGAHGERNMAAPWMAWLRVQNSRSCDSTAESTSIASTIIKSVIAVLCGSAYRGAAAICWA